MEGMEIYPIGKVKSAYSSAKEMPMSGAVASIVIEDRYLPALDQLDKNSHLIIIGFMSGADRDVLKVRPRQMREDYPEIGVFSTRSPARPNPISVTVCKLIDISGNTIVVDNLDLIDGTPVLDIKPYIPNADCFFSARDGIYDDIQKSVNDEVRYEIFEREAVKFHGEMCTYLVITCRMMIRVYSEFGSLRRDGLVVICNAHPCIADCVQGMTYARAGLRRLVLGTNVGRLEFMGKDKRLIAEIGNLKGLTVEDAKNVELAELVKFVLVKN
ncbi:MAG: tRNA (N6-threonylcarbamoyladenosine(37)-N6)-methyltransferase TrmO [Actinobacteria bacterium]|nr:tRNA (N6-threonylcarbamoyladenosine(37)-N6)-methyltransferase TrmO [Actinomycetota bacterium]